MKTKCPHCSTVYSIAAENTMPLGRIARCGRCQQTFELFTWEGLVTAGEAFETHLEEFLLHPGSQPAMLKESESSSEPCQGHAPMQRTGEPSPSQQPLAAAAPHAAFLPDDSIARQTPHSNANVSLPKSPGQLSTTSKSKRREVSSELVGSDDEDDRAQERLAAMCLAIAASLLTLILVAFLLWPKGKDAMVPRAKPPTPSPNGLQDRTTAMEQPPFEFGLAMMAKPAPASNEDPAPRMEPGPVGKRDGASALEQGAASESKQDQPGPSRVTGPSPFDNRLPGAANAGTPSPSGLPRPVMPPAESSPEPSPLPPQEAKESVALIRTPFGSGTGFVVAAHIVATNRHVVQDAFTAEMTVNFPETGDERLKVTSIVYEDWGRDLCLLEVPTDRQPLPVASDYKWSREQVRLISNPSVGPGATLRNTQSDGTLLSLVTIDGYDFYQFDANVDHGSSGGPVLNSAGHVIAVVARKATDGAASELRKRLQQLGETFEHRKFTHAPAGLTYGIPVQALGKALASVTQPGSTASAKADVEHAARVLLLRLAVLGNLYLLEAVAHAPPRVRQEWQLAQSGGYNPSAPSNRGRGQPTAEQLPLHLADAIHRDLESDGRTLIDAYSRDLTSRLSELQKSQPLEVSVKRDLQNLNRKVTTLRKFAEQPPMTLHEYGDRFFIHQKGLESSIIRVAAQLTMLPAGPAENTQGQK